MPLVRKNDTPGSTVTHIAVKIEAAKTRPKATYDSLKQLMAQRISRARVGGIFHETAVYQAFRYPMAELLLVH